MKGLFTVLALSLIGGFIFNLLHIPIPWMLGPIVLIVLAQFFYNGELYWSSRFADIGVVILGTSIGLQFNIGLFNNLGSLIYYLLLFNVILITLSIVIAYFIAKFAHIDLKSAILGSIPGGLGQIVLFALEEKDVNLGAISYFQVIRLLLVVVIVPFIVAGHAVAAPESTATLSISLIVLMMIAWLCSYLMQRCHVPVAFFITPIIFVILLQVTTPLTMPAVPSYTMVIAQLLIGAHIGLMLKPNMLRLPIRVLIAGILSALALITVTLGSSFLMSWLMDTSFATSFLSTAPGGLDQMVILADAMKADVSLVSLFQTFRLLFIFLLILPLMKLFYRIKNKRKANKADHQTEVMMKS